MRTLMAGYSSPFWMTIPQANALGAKVLKGEKSSVVVYYGQSRTKGEGGDDADSANPDETRVFRFQKSYRVFNACQIEGLPDSFHPEPIPVPDHPPAEPIPYMQEFFDAIDITTVFSGTAAPVIANGGFAQIVTFAKSCDGPEPPLINARLAAPQPSESRRMNAHQAYAPRSVPEFAGLLLVAHMS